MLDLEGLGVAGEGDDVVILVEGQLGDVAPGRAVGPEHGKSHRSAPFS
jgi:hypothetical protein